MHVLHYMNSKPEKNRYSLKLDDRKRKQFTRFTKKGSKKKIEGISSLPCSVSYSLNGMRLCDGEECYVREKKFNSSACMKIFFLFLSLSRSPTKNHCVVYFANSFVTISHFRGRAGVIWLFGDMRCFSMSLDWGLYCDVFRACGR